MTGEAETQALFHSKWSGALGRDAPSLVSNDPTSVPQLLYFHRYQQLKHVLDQRLPGKLRTLEVGCGRGTVSEYLARDGHDTTLLDLSEASVALARRHFERADLKGAFVVGDAESLQFSAETFDFVFSIGLLEHFDDPSRMVEEKLRVCRPGGIVWEEVIPSKWSVQSIAAATQTARHGYRRLKKARSAPRGPARADSGSTAGRSKGSRRQPRYRVRTTPDEIARIFADAGAGRFTDVGGIEHFWAVPIARFTFRGGTIPNRLSFTLQRAFLKARARVMRDPWRSSALWGQSFVVLAKKSSGGVEPGS